MAHLLLVLLLAACGEADEGEGCEITGCGAGEVCFHDAYDLPGSCRDMPVGCDAAAPCACDALLALCADPEHAVCDTPDWADADLICG